MRKITATIAAAATALTLTACSTTGTTTTPTATVTVTTEAKPQPTGDLPQQFRQHGLMTIGLTDDILRETGESMCKARDVGASHRMVKSVASDHLADFYDSQEIETIMGIWYDNLCPEHSTN